MAQDSSKSDFWETRYRDGVMPWDAGRVPHTLLDFLAQATPGARVLVPGCGSAYEVYVLAEHGMDVLAIDFSAAAVKQARQKLGCFADRVMEADFFAFDHGTGFDIVYERAFLCALPPRMWEDYARRMTQVIKPGGRLAGFFYFDDAPRGPPFGIDEMRLHALLGPGFELDRERPVSDSIAIFQGKERWLEWRRKSGAP